MAEQSEQQKQLLAEIKKQIEYYLSDSNLKQDQFFHDLIKESDIQAVPIDSFLNCNKIKKLQATKEQIKDAVANSEEVELTGDGSGVKRKNDRPLPEFEPKPSKKLKTENNSNGNAPAPKDDSKNFDPKIYKLTLAKADENIKWDKVQGAILEATGIKVGYTRINGTEGNVAVNKNALTEADLAKLSTTVKINQENELKVEECLDDDLKAFYNNHGRHLDMCLERSGLKRKIKSNKQRENIDFVFNNERYTSLTPLKNIFKGITAKTSDDDVIGASDQKNLMELLKYHENYDEKVKDFKHFTVGQHPLYKQTRCFFVVRSDDTKEDFSSTKCIENIKKKYNISDE